MGLAAKDAKIAKNMQQDSPFIKYATMFRCRSEQKSPHNIPNNPSNLALKRMSILIILYIKFCHAKPPLTPL